MITIMIKHMEVHKSNAGSRQGQAEQLRNSTNILLASVATKPVAFSKSL